MTIRPHPRQITFTRNDPVARAAKFDGVIGNIRSRSEPCPIRLNRNAALTLVSTRF